MKRTRFFIVASVLVLGGIVMLFSNTFRAATKSEAWFAAGSEPKSYDMGITTSEHHTGKSSAYMKSVKTDIQGFGTYMQMTEAGQYVDKSVRMTGWIRSKNVEDWAGMWFRVDGDNPNNTLSFDNMQDRPIKGTTEWKKYDITLDVPKEGKALAFGVLLSGKGEVYFDDISFEILGPATGKGKMNGYLQSPSNLDFEQ
jgi:hypothetical protein